MSDGIEEVCDELIKEFYQSAPLYVERAFARRQDNSWTTVVDQIELHCDNCKISRPFNNALSGAPRPHGGSLPAQGPKRTSGVKTVEFDCATCSSSPRTYYIGWKLEDETINIIKRGEYPRAKLDRDPILDKFFEEDQALYEKAKICLAQHYGIGGFAYLRQIVEKNIKTLLESIKAEAEMGEASADIMRALEKLKNESPMSDKIAVANAALPAYLMPGGANPLGKLYGSLSAGIHSHTDEDCLKRSNEILACLKYLVGEMADRKKGRDNFAAVVGRMD